ncbi:Abi family protein [Arsenicicoccus dermatophilus]|uniref:Abi family protein n=1 Tax=Arsenicicoccus dermatophilus TaxID=1076331 RepID=UPI0039175368
MEYTKPHLTYNEQVDRLRERGLAVPDEAAAVRLLRTVGYYRLSAYVYPFRVLLPAGAREKGHTRSEDLVEGASIDHVRDLWEFDRRLRLLVLDGAEVIEVGLRAQLAYVLGRRDTFGHLNEASLDQQRCNKPRTVQGQKRRAFERWLARYEELRQRARLEPFVLYNSQKYGPDKLPVWVAVEFLDFGAAIRLYDLLHDDDRNEIARAMGFKTGATLHPVLLACSNTRNTAAHHGRLWNRPAISTPRAKIYDAGPMLDGWASLKHNYMYAQLLLMAYLTRHIDPTSRWPIHVRERLSKFPELPGIELHTDMGVP